MMYRSILLLGLAFSPLASAQLRPRRVGGAAVNAMGQQEETADGEDPMAELAKLRAENAALKAQAGGGAGGLDGLAAMMNGGAGGFDMAKILESMGDMSKLAENPMLKGLADANPELAEMLNNPEMMKEKMAEMAQMFSSEEGQGMAAKMMEEMQSVMTDPDKLQAGLQQLMDNPALKGLADAMPGLAEAMSDPESMREQVTKTAEMFQKLQDPEQMQELLQQMGGAEGMQEGMAGMMKMLQGAGGVDSDALANMLSGLGGAAGVGEDEEGGESLKDRVDRLMQQAGMNGDGAAAELDEF